MKTHTYDATAVLGLPVTLIDAVSKDADGTIEIPRLNALLASVAVARALAPEQLVGAELRFLRHVLDYTGSAFAAAIDLSNKSVVSRWENGKARPGNYTEKAIRQLVLNLLGPRAPGVDIGANPIPGMKIRPRDEALPMTFAWRRRRLAEGRRPVCYVPVPPPVASEPASDRPAAEAGRPGLQRRRRTRRLVLEG